jgi:hypothetical protein
MEPVPSQKKIDPTKTIEKQYQMVSLNVETINTLDLYQNKILGIAQQGPSIVPTYNPGFKLIHFNLKNNRDNQSITMTQQTQYYMDIEKYNEEHDLRPDGNVKLEFDPSGCSTKSDYGLQEVSPSAITYWIRKAQKSGPKYKSNPIRKYFTCLEIHTSSYNDQIRLAKSTVTIVVIAVIIFFVGALYVVVSYIRKRPESANHYFEDENARLLRNGGGN